MAFHVVRRLDGSRPVIDIEGCMRWERSENWDFPRYIRNPDFRFDHDGSRYYLFSILRAKEGFWIMAGCDPMPREGPCFAYREITPEHTARVLAEVMHDLPQDLLEQLAANQSPSTALVEPTNHAENRGRRARGPSDSMIIQSGDDWLRACARALAEALQDDPLVISFWDGRWEVFDTLAATEVWAYREGDRPGMLFRTADDRWVRCDGVYNLEGSQPFLTLRAREELSRLGRHSPPPGLLYELSRAERAFFFESHRPSPVDLIPPERIAAEVARIAERFPRYPEIRARLARRAGGGRRAEGDESQSSERPPAESDDQPDRPTTEMFKAFWAAEQGARQTAIAETMKISQATVSRYIKRVKDWADAGNPIPSLTELTREPPKVYSVDPRKLDRGDVNNSGCIHP
jgi:hypothetical protein